jgi:hypothetical protein
MYFYLFLLPFLASPTSQPTQVKSVKIATQKSSVIKRGASLSKKKAISLDTVAADPEKYADQILMIKGKTSSVCTKKGCWMTLKGKRMSARVTFKDYSFFVPTDAINMNAKVEGTVQVKVMSEAERKHLAEDEKVDVSKVPKVELRIIAHGVELWKV